MFDVGFLELVVIGLVALIVIGPERLPRVARTAGMWVGRARRAFTSVKEEIDRELRAEELKEIMRKQADSQSLERILEPPAKTHRSEADSVGPGAGGKSPEPPSTEAKATESGDPP